jgi:hypothetical protein
MRVGALPVSETPRMRPAACCIGPKAPRRAARCSSRTPIPKIVVFFAKFLRENFDVQDEKMRVKCSLFADHAERQHEIEDYRLARLALPRTCLCKSAVNVYSKYSQKKRTNKLPYGTCSLRVHSTRIVQTIYGSIQEYGGFDRPEWLD